MCKEAMTLTVALEDGEIQTVHTEQVPIEEAIVWQTRCTADKGPADCKYPSNAS